MLNGIFIALVFNAALLLAATQLLHTLKTSGAAGQSWHRDWLMGAALGALCIGLMMIPLTLRPGLVFDVRSVLLAVAGLFFGVIPTGVAMAMAAAYRLSLGGVGQWMGVSVILASGLIGLGWARWRRPRLDAIGWPDLWALGLVVHVAMLTLTFLLPGEIALGTLKAISLPILIIYPALTVALGQLVSSQLARLNIEHSLKDSQARLHQAIHAGNVGLWDWDLNTQRVYFSPEWKRQIGYQDHEIENDFNEWRSRVHPDDLEHVLEKIQQFIAVRRPEYVAEFRFRHKDGSYRWILAQASISLDQAGKPARMLGSHVDITRQKETEIALRESEFLFRSQFDFGNIGIAVTSPEKGWLRVNPRLCRMLGYAEAELKEMTWAEMTHPDDLAADVAQFDRLLTGEIDSYELDKRFYNKAGEIVHTHLAVACYRDQGTVKFVIASLQDITESMKARARIEKIAAHVPGVIYQYQLWPDGHSAFPYASQGIQDIYGVRPAEVKDDATAVFKVLHPDDLAHVSASIAQSAETLTTWRDQYRVNLPGGKTIWVEGESSPERQADGSILWHGHIRDITEHKQAEAALRQSEATIRSKLKTITEPDGDIGSLQLADIIDSEMLQSLMEDFYRLTGMLGAILDISGKVLVAVGWQDICTQFHRCHPATRENCIESDTLLTRGVPAGTFKAYHCKNNMWDMVTPLMIGDRHVGNVFIGQFFYEGEIPDVALFLEQARRYGFDETAYLAALGRVPRFSREKVETGMRFYSKLAGIISTLSFSAIQQSRMLAERERAEAALQRTAMEWSQAMDFFADAIALIDLDDRITRVNRAFTQMLGLTATQVIGQDMAIVLHHQPEAPACPVCRARHDRRDGFFTLEADHPANSTSRPINVMVRMIRNEAGEPVNMLMGIHDLSADREQQALQYANQHLRELDRLKSLFIASMSHELRTPLNTIIGFTGMIVEDMVGPVSDQQRDYLQRVARSGKHLLDLINDVIDVSKIEAGSLAVEYTPFSLDEVVARAREEIEPRAQEKALGLQFDVPADIVLHNDRKRLLQCLLNLLGNAVKYTEHGQIRLAAEVVGDELAIAISDTGIGIPKEDLDKLFRPFIRLESRLKIASGGSGLGLYLTRKLAREVLGGDVEVESRVHEGSRFRLRLPLDMSAKQVTLAADSHEETVA